MSLNFNEKKVILYGECLWCRGFYDKFSGYFNIEKIVYTELEKEVAKFFEDVNVQVLQKKAYSFDEQEKSIIIVCAGNGKKEAHDEFLYSMGYIYGQDYVDELFAEHFYIQEVWKCMKDKEIWIFGSGNNGKTFYTQHKSELNIAGFLSNFGEEKVCMNLPVCRPKEVMEMENKFIVVCSDAEIQMCNQLMEYGLVSGKQFVTSKRLMKKLFVGWGSCQVYSIYMMLLKNPSFEKMYDRIFVFDSKLQECNHADKQRIYTYGQVCDVLFYNSEGIVDSNKAIVERFYQAAKVYNIPFYSFRGQLMQVTEECSKYAVRYENIKSHFTYWFIGDAEIERMLEQGLNKEQIITRISDENYWSDIEIEKRWRLENRKVELCDKLSSLQVRQFIKENYKNMIVFKDGIHFCKELCIELANQLAKQMRIEEIDEKQEKKILDECSVEDTNVLPIYPAVIKFFNMNMSNAEEKYNFVYIDGTVERLEFKDYVGKYIDYVQCMNNIERNYGTRVI